MKDDLEHPVPEDWRPTFRQIANALVRGDFELRVEPIAGVAPIDPETAQMIADNIADYGDALVPLREKTWRRSLYMDGASLRRSGRSQHRGRDHQ